MGKYILKRLLIALPVLIGITVIDYLLMTRAGNPLDLISGARVSEAAKAVRAEQLGLNDPPLVQYVRWLWKILHGNFGVSLKTHQAVSEMILSHLFPTLLLMGTSLLVSLLFTIPFGVYSAVHQYEAGDYLIVGLSFLSMSVPGFFLSLLLIYLFTVRLGILPSGGMVTLGGGGGFWDVVRHMVMPVLVLSVSMTGTNLRYIRSAVLEILGADYLRTATAKGIGRFRVIMGHAFRNALIPVITVLGMEIPVLFGGSIIVEQIFNWPGLGLLTMSAILSRDYPVIMAVSLVSAVIVLLGNLLTDLLYALADPQVTYS